MKTSIYVTTCLAILFFGSISWHVIATTEEVPKPLGLILTSEKDSYYLGEVVKFRFTTKNISEQPEILEQRPDVFTGYLSVYISGDGKNFDRYSNSNWGRREGGSIRLNAGEIFVSEATILWNEKPQILRTGKGRILTDYAFPIQGKFWVKAVLTIPDDSPAGFKHRIESEPVLISVLQPQGEDARVWDQIKSDGEIAYFLQEGDIKIPEYKSEERQKLRSRIDELIELNPVGFYATGLRAGLERFNASEEKRRAVLEKAKVKNDM